MKKFLKVFVIALMVAFTANAQTSFVEKSKLLDNTFVGVSGGAHWGLWNTSTNSTKFLDEVEYNATVRIGKYWTPVFGTQVAYQGFFLGDASNTIVDASTLTLDGLFNMSNLIGGYKGAPRTVEVVGVLGAGWGHAYGHHISNDIALKAGAQIDFNIGSKKSWQINIIPTWTWMPEYNVDEMSYASLEVGVTYKFKCSNGTHNFKTGWYYTDAEYDALNDKLNETLAQVEYMKRNPKVVTNTKEVIVEKIVEVPSKDIHSVVGFAINSDQIVKSHRANIAQAAKVIAANNWTVTVVGYADANTGTSEYNMALSQKRADAVKAMLMHYGVDEARIKTVAKGDSEQTFDDNDLNRAVMFVVE